MLLGATYSATAASTAVCTKCDMTGRFMMFRPFLVKGVQATSTLGCPRRVKVHRAKNGGSGVSCNLQRMIPTKPLKSTYTGILMFPGR